MLKPENSAVRPEFACAINCMDGRTQEAVRKYMIRRYKVKYVDMPNAPGPSKILAENTNSSWIELIRYELGISIQHGSKVVAIVAHPDCTGNPASKEEQIEHLRQARETVKSFGYQVEVILLWVNEDWKTVQRISIHPERSTILA